MLKRHDRGDTMIEVLLAFTLFTMVAVGTFVMMSRGIDISQRSLESTLVREQIDAQAEIIRFVHDTNPVIWGQITSNLVATAGNTCTGHNESGSFFINVNESVPGSFNASRLTTTAANYERPSVYSEITYGSTPKARGMWVRVIKVQESASAPVAYDVHIRACWEGAGSDGPNMTLGTIVRLYET